MTVNETQTDTGHPRRWAILSVLLISLIVVVIDNTILNVAMRVLADPNEGLGANQSQLAWAINSYTLVFAGLLFMAGVIADRIGRRRLLLIGLTVFGLASVLAAYSQTPEHLIYARALLGVGAAAIMPSTLAIISHVFSAKERGKAIGVWTASVGIGIAIGPVAGGALLEHFWWGSIFLINVPVVILGLILVRFLVPESKATDNQRPDVIGVILTIAGLVTLTYGVIRAGETGSWGTIDVWGTIVLGIALLAAFVLYELRIPNAALDVRLFKEPRFASATTAIFLVFFGAMGLFFFMAFYLQIVRGLSPFHVGLMMMAFAVGQIIFAPLSSTMTDKFGSRAVGIIAMTVMSGVFISYLFLDETTPLWVPLLQFFLQAAAMANIMPPAMNTIMASLPRERAGVGSAVANAVRQTAGSFGVAVLGTVLAQAYRSDLSDNLDMDIPPSAAESIAATYGYSENIGGDTEAIMGPAIESFIGALHTTAVVAGVISMLGIVVAAKYFPKKVRTDSHDESDALAAASAVAAPARLR
ncbi:MFS transporter [Natronoglycomyces albus]|uniref:MFS transporter n=1 Tax=Natronoglycomyces albus TaxID=2811108 RepID=A0A895XSA7_9ACTN|nr:MFS transporter [Natronoglycomyces albus]QSB06393.1 MFS transporter [Natronoglycomyces albus]